MSLSDLNRAMEIIEANPGLGLFVGPRDEALIVAAENVLGGQLPPSYRQFVQQLGAGSFGSFEIYGVVTDKFVNSTVPNGVWATLTTRRQAGLPKDIVIVGDTGDGLFYCVRLQGKDLGESAVFIYGPGVTSDGQRPEVIAQDFGEFFLNNVRAQL